VIPELPEIISGFASCYPKFPNKIRVSGISGSGSGIPGSGFGLRVFLPSPSYKPREGSIKGVRQQKEGRIPFTHQDAQDWREEEENEEGGLLRD
jgi:hypothetical protein